MLKAALSSLLLLAIGASVPGCGSDDPANPGPTPTPKGTVAVTVQPTGISASWTLTGPDSYSHNGVDSETLADLKPGDYTLTWGSAAGYLVPNPAAETKTLGDGQTVTFSVKYLLVAGTVALDLTNTDATQSGYVRVTDAPSLEPQMFTIETWITPRGPGFGAADQYGAFVFGKPTEGAAGFWLGSWGISWSDVDSTVSFFVAGQRGVSGSLIKTANATAPVSTTFHVAATFDGSTLMLYIDGVALASDTYAGSGVDYGDEDVLIGAANYAAGFPRRFDGVIDEIRLWDHARSASQITDHMSCRLSGNEAGLLGYWDFEANDLSDASGNGHNGTAEEMTPGTVALVSPQVVLTGCP